MPGTFTLRLNTKQFDGAVERLGAKAHVAIVRSLKRAATSARAVMSRSMATDLGLKVSDMKDAIVIDAGRVEADHTIRLTATGAPIPLIAFKARGPEPSRGKGRGVTARLPGGAGRYPHAFIATTKSGHRGVFERRLPSTSKSRGAWSKNLPIYELHGPSIVKVFRKFSRDGARAGQESLLTNLKHEFRWAIDQARQGS